MRESGTLRKFLRLMNSPFIFGILLILLRFAPVFFGQTILFGDNYFLMVPGKLFTAQWLAQGILPLWNPLLFAGIPWIGDVNQSILYPSTLLFLVFSPAVALNITIVSHQILTIVGMYFLAKQFVKQQWLMATAAILWTFSPQVVSTFNNISTLQSISWMPWVLLAGLFVGKNWKYSAVFSLIVLLQFAGGYPQHVLYSIISAVVLSTWCRRSSLKNGRELLFWLTRWFFTALLTISLTAIFWLPFLETLRDSTRAIQSQTQASSGSLMPSELLKLVSPYLFDNPMAGMKWGPSWNKPPNVSLYFSWVGLLVFGAWVFSPRKSKSADDWFFLSASLACIVLALGENVPFYSLIQHLPILNSMRGVSTILMIPTIYLSLWLVMKVEQFIFAEKRLNTLISLFSVCTAVGISAYLAQRYLFAYGWTFADTLLANKLSEGVFHTLERDQVITASFILFFTITSALTAGIIWAFTKKKFLLVVFLLALEMAIMTQGHYRYGNNSVYSIGAEQSTVKALLKDSDLQNYRVLTRNYNAPYSDFGAYYEALTVRQPFSDSYVDEEEMSSFSHLQRMRDGATPDWNKVIGVPIINGYTTLVPLSIHSEFTDSSEASINNLPTIATTNTALQKWATRYYIVDTWFPNYDERFPEKVVSVQKPWVLYELPNVLSRFRYANNESISMTSFSENPNIISFTFINESSQNELIIADRFDRNWQAKINGVDGVVHDFENMRKISIPSGSVQVELQYVPKNFYLGLVATIVTALMMIGILVLEQIVRKQSRKKYD